MYRGLVFVAILCVVFGHENGLEPHKEHSKEKFAIDVKIVEEEESENGPRKTEVKVNLVVTIEEDAVKVNGKLTELDVLTMYELDAEIEYSPDDIRISPVTVHVMVAKTITSTGHQYLIEEQVQLVEGKKVEQLDIQVLTIHMDVNGKEFKRTIAKVSYEETRMKKTELTRYCGKDDEKPMEWTKPRLPDERHLGDHHHKHHHGKSFCSRFHKLPFAARVAILVGLVFVVLASVMCCAMCCCRKNKKKAYEISKADDFKSEFDMDDEEEAEPLPEKLAFDDKEVLIA